jgi:hypothetical protein
LNLRCGVARTSIMVAHSMRNVREVWVALPVEVAIAATTIHVAQTMRSS